MNEIVKKITDRVNEMPPVSGNTVQILQLISNKNYIVKDLVNLVSMDISLTSKILQIVNSASFGLRSKVGSIERAVGYLGSKTILSIIVNDSLNDIYSGPLDGYIAEEGDFWEYSLRTAIASKLVAELIQESSDIAYTAGLLHDIGKAVINDFLKNKFEDNLIEKLEIGEDKDFIDAEKELLSTDHAVVGEQLAKKWGFPEPLQTAIRFHHKPSMAPDKFKKLCMAVHIGELFAMLGGFGTGLDTLAYKIDKEAYNYLKLDRTQFSRLLLNIDSEFNNAKNKITQ